MAEDPQVLKGHTSDVMGCDFFDDYLATGSADKTVRVWQQDADGKFEEKEYSPLRGHTYGVNCVQFSTYSTLLASCSTDGKAILWHIQNGEKLGEVQHASRSPIRVCSFAPSSSVLATAGDDEKVVLWDVSTMAIVRSFEGHEAMVTCVAFTPDSAFLLSCSTAEDMLLWDASYGHGKCLTVVNNAHDLGVLGCDFSPQYESVSENGFLCGKYTLATCGNDDLIKLWAVETSSTKNIFLLRTLEGHTGNVMTCCFSPDGKSLASGGGDRLVILWDSKTGEKISTFEGHSRFVTCCAFSNDGHLASGSNDKTVNIWTISKENINLSKRSSDSRKNYLSWSVDDVLTWLKIIHLDKLSETFRNNHIDGKELMNLNHENLVTALKIESFGQRSKVLRAIQCLRNPLWQHVLSETKSEMEFPEFHCPITQEVMRNPVVAADGYTYERQAIEEWFESGKKTSPMTNEDLGNLILIPNLVLLQLIQKCKN